MIKVFVWAVLVSAIFVGCASFEPTSEEIKMNEINQKAIEFERQGFDKEMANSLAHIWRQFDKQDLLYGNLDLYKKILNAGSK